MFCKLSFKKVETPRCKISILKYAILVPMQEACPSSSSPDTAQARPEPLVLKVTLLANEWGSSKGGLSTINRTFAIHLAKDPLVEVTMLVPEFECGEKDKRVAKSHNISIREAGHLQGHSGLRKSKDCEEVMMEYFLGRNSARPLSPECGRWSMVRS